MRRLLLLLLLSPLLTAAAQNPEQLYTASREQLDVTKIVLAQETAWNKGDLEAYLSHFKDSKDTEAVLNGSVQGLANIRNAYHASFPNKEAMGQLEQSEVAVRELGPEYALATGKYRLLRNRRNGGDAQGSFIEIFQKDAGKWQLIYSQTT